ncbi:hypothetical protein LguiA_034199 [Lonicera macranthoides]
MIALVRDFDSAAIKNFRTNNKKDEDLLFGRKGKESKSKVKRKKRGYCRGEG